MRTQVPYLLDFHLQIISVAAVRVNTQGVTDYAQRRVWIFSFLKKDLGQVVNKKVELLQEKSPPAILMRLWRSMPQCTEFLTYTSTVKRVQKTNTNQSHKGIGVGGDSVVMRCANTSCLQMKSSAKRFAYGMRAVTVASFHISKSKLLKVRQEMVA